MRTFRRHPRRSVATAAGRTARRALSGRQGGAAAYGAGLAAIVLLTLLPTAGCWRRYAECSCPTDARSIYPGCGEEAVRRCPCQPDPEFHGLKPTCWSAWPTEWSQYQQDQCGPLPATVAPTTPLVPQAPPLSLPQPVEVLTPPPTPPAPRTTKPPRTETPRLPSPQETEPTPPPTLPEPPAAQPEATPPPAGEPELTPPAVDREARQESDEAEIPQLIPLPAVPEDTSAAESEPANRLRDPVRIPVAAETNADGAPAKSADPPATSAAAMVEATSAAEVQPVTASPARLPDPDAATAEVETFYSENLQQSSNDGR